MATPTIALRFRDTTAGVDTMTEHLRLLAASGMVWWGWWKKDTEELRANMLARRLPPGSAKTLLLADSVSRMWSMTCTKWTSDKDQIDINLIPAYYRDYVDKVAAFFLITAIDPVPYDKKMADMLEPRTILDLDDPEEISNAKATAHGQLLAPIQAGARSAVLHVSDLHFGTDYGFRTRNERAPIGDQRYTLTECLVQDLERIGMTNEIGAVLVTGDFISSGDWDDGVRESILKEFEALKSALNINDDAIIPLPGNHDIVRYRDGQVVGVAEQAVERQTNQRHEREFRTFVEELVGRNWQKPLNFVCRIQLQSADLLICVLNSCTITATQWTEYGFVGPSGLGTIKLLGSQPSVRPTYKCVALHHHLLPVAGVEVPQAKGVSLTLDASMLLDEAQRAGAQLALHGHQHIPKIARYQNVPLMSGSALPPIYVIANGSTGVKRERLGNGERNTYCVLKFTDTAATLHFRELRADAKEGGTLFNGDLGLSPYMSKG